ncbi:MULTISPECIES: OsmC family protein [Pasteurellaceae]|uniref:OsmC protein n=1 Tax=Mannheimia succiniciproducens (strain KCTC 0769BP / MBEL55E) TaxID=221988 RepID=Q65QZ9_MANSM|nr:MULTISPECIES: OsmC family protein [Pasteurellaceae]AAU38611.1 unknown [[Mannheimia] succiniciproducens MBEL55E]WGE85340.1 OsmC family protein [Actinobacillus equuli subsp. haemolyticus]
MKAVKVEYQGKLRQQITHLSNGQTVITDAGKSVGRHGENISPADLLAASLAGCAMTIMALRAEQLGADFSGCYAEVEKEADMQQFQVTKIVIHFYLKAGFSDEVRQAVENATRDLCIVGRSLRADLVQEFHFVYQ